MLISFSIICKSLSSVKSISVILVLLFELLLFALKNDLKFNIDALL